MSPNKKITFIQIYIVLMFILVGISYILQIPEQLAKRIIGAYFIIGVVLSFKYKIPIFGRGELTEEKVNTLTDINIFLNVFFILLGIMLLVGKV